MFLSELALSEPRELSPSERGGWCHFERGGQHGLPSWNPLAFASCGAELLDYRGVPNANFSRDADAVTCPACRNLAGLDR